MIRARAAATLAFLALAGCEAAGLEPLPPVAPFDPASLEFAAASDSVARTAEQSWSERPFANGSLAVVAIEGQDLSTWRLVPCRGGEAICAWDQQGPVGQLRITPNYYVVTGLFDRTFWLSYGGDGYVERDGRLVGLAWNSRTAGTGIGTDPVLETPAPHGDSVIAQLR